MTGIGTTVNREKEPNESKLMNDKFDELTKGLAQSVTRRGALKKFGVGVAGIALAALGFGDKAQAKTVTKKCNTHGDCPRCYECVLGYCRFNCI